MGATVGVAFLSESNWSPVGALALADTRMYALKPARHAGKID